MGRILNRQRLEKEEVVISGRDCTKNASMGTCSEYLSKWRLIYEIIHEKA